MTTPIRAIGSTIISLFRAYFSSFVSILLVKVIAPEETLVIVSRIVIC